MKFKIGDIVRLKYHSLIVYRKYYHQTYEIIEILSDCYRLQHVHFARYFFAESSLELVSEEERLQLTPEAWFDKILMVKHLGE